MSSKKPTVSVLLVNRNGQKFLPGCLESLRKQSFKDFELVFVDNASTDGSWKLAKQFFPSCTLMRNNTGLGFCGGNNKGYPFCRGEFVLLLNNDTLLPPNVLGTLVETIKSDGHIAIVGGSQYPFGGGLKAKPIVGIFQFLGEGASAEQDRDLDGFAVLSCGLVRKSAFPKRIFDPIYETGGEDVFLSLDAIYRGWRVVNSANARFFHHGTLSRGFEPDRFYNYEKSGWINHLRFYSWRTILLLAPLVLTEYFLRTAASVLSLRFDKLWLRLEVARWILSNQQSVAAARRSSQAAKKISDSKILRLFAENKIKLFSTATWRYAAYQLYIKSLLFTGFVA